MSVTPFQGQSKQRRDRQIMARPAQLTTEMEHIALQKVKEAKTARDLRAGLSVLIPKRCGCTNAVVGEMLGVGIVTVVGMQRKIRKQVDGVVQPKGKWGGRHRQLMTFEEERKSSTKIDFINKVMWTYVTAERIQEDFGGDLYNNYKTMWNQSQT